MCYLLTTVMRDFLIYFHHLSSTSFMNFRKDLYVHVLCIPVDCTVLIFIGIHGYKALQMDSTLDCERDLICGKFVTVFRNNITASFIYILFNSTMKLCMILFFTCCLDGNEMLNMDNELMNSNRR